ncbi:MAG: VCBS repeat-containing protein [Acidobacteriota bacterium]
MKRTLANLGGWAALSLAVGGVWGCAAATPSAPAGSQPTPTPNANRMMSRLNPNVVEESDTHFVERFPKKDFIRVDETHFRSPIMPRPVKFFKEDEEYFYVWTPKVLPEVAAAARPEGAEGATPTPTPLARTPVVPLADFEDVAASRAVSPLRFEIAADTGLPRQGLWRANFVLHDMNGDGILDVVAPPARLGGDPKPHVWLGDGKGHYKAWPLTFTENGKIVPTYAVDYGGIDAGDIDGDGKADFVTVSHNGGIVSYFGDGQGGFAVCRLGLPQREFSGQSVALLDLNGDKNLDIVVSRDGPDDTSKDPVDLNQVRAYLFLKGRSWAFRRDSLPGAAYSYTMNTWDYDRDGKTDLLIGSHVFASQNLVWKGTGSGEMTPIAFSDLESYAFHFGTRPGSIGRDAGKRPAFADAYSKFMQEPLITAVGVNVYSLVDGSWKKQILFRKKKANTFLYAVAMGDVNGDGLDDVVFPDSDLKKVRVFLQGADGSFGEIPADQEPAIDSPAQCVRLADVNGDGRVDLVVAKTIASTSPADPGGWSIYLNR